MQILRNLFVITFIVLISLVAFADCNAPQSLKELQDCWQTSWNSQNLTVLMKLYSDNAVLHRNDITAVGTSAIESYWKGLIKANNVQFSISVVTPTQKAEVGYDYGGYQENITTPDKKQDQKKGAYSIFAERIGNKWQIVLQDFVLQNLPSPAPAPQMFSKNSNENQESRGMAHVRYE